MLNIKSMEDLNKLEFDTTPEALELIELNLSIGIELTIDLLGLVWTEGGRCLGKVELR